MESKIEREMNSILKKEGLQDFDFSDTKGLNCSYQLTNFKNLSDKNKSESKPFEIYEQAKKNYIAKIEILETKIDRISKIIVNLDSNFMSFYKIFTNSCLCYLNKNGLFINSSIEVCFNNKINNTNFNSDISEVKFLNDISASTNCYFNFEVNDMIYDIKEERYENIMTTFNNNLTRLKDIVRLLNNSFDLISSTNGKEYNSKLFEIINNYKSIDNYINLCLTGLVECEAWDLKENNIKNTLNDKLKAIGNSGSLKECNLLYEKCVENIGFDNINQENNYQEIEYFSNLISKLKEISYKALNEETVNTNNLKEISNFSFNKTQMSNLKENDPLLNNSKFSIHSNNSKQSSVYSITKQFSKKSLIEEKLNSDFIN